MKAKLLFGLMLTTATAFGQAGANDPTFIPQELGNGDGVGTGSVQNVIQCPDGKTLIAGRFGNYNGVPRTGIARLNSNGSLDLSFAPEIDLHSGVYHILLQPDGKILVSGDLYAPNLPYVTWTGLTRLNSDGSLDSSFHPGTGPADNFRGCVMALQPDGKILIAGHFSSYNGTPRASIARLNSDGTLDASLNSGAGVGVGDDDRIDALVLQSDGKILIGGDFTSYNGTAQKGIARLNSDGSLDLGFNHPIPLTNTTAMAILPSGKILVGRYSNTNPSATDKVLLRLNSNGSWDHDFNSIIPDHYAVSNITVQPDDRILVGLTTNYPLPDSSNCIQRFNMDGSLDASFYNQIEGETYGSVYAMALASDGKILIGGDFTSYGNMPAPNGIAQLDNVGQLDTGYNPPTGADGQINEMVVQPDDKILIAGDFHSYNGAVASGFARINSDGSVDPDFQTGSGIPMGTNEHINAISLQLDGKILIGGSFNSYNGTPRKQIARIKTNGTLDLSFNSGSGLGGAWPNVTTVTAIAVQTDGKILVGGEFISYNGTPRQDLARINADGSLDLSFDPGSLLTGDYGIATMVLQSDGKILVGGNFTPVYGGWPTQPGLLRLNSDGSLDASFNIGNTANGSVSSILLQPDGRVVIAGGGIPGDTYTSSNIVRIFSDGGVDNSFQPGTGSSPGGIISAVQQSDGKIVIGGDFDYYDGEPRSGFARINSDGSLDYNFYPGSGITTYFPWVLAMAIQANGKTLIAGEFSAYNGTPRNNIARIESDGSNPSHTINLNLTTDAFGPETTWELTRADGSPVATGGPYPAGTPMIVSEQIPVAGGCYKFLMHDAGGNGIQGGGYVLTYDNDQRIVDANGDFGSISTTGTKFCVPLGPVELWPAYCDEMDHPASEQVKCYGMANAIGYQFWFFDPHGSFQYRTLSTWNQVGPNRIAQLPTDLGLNVRVRALLSDSSYTEFGPACKLMVTGPGMAPQELRSTIADAGSSMSIWPNPLSEELLQLNMNGLATDLATAEVKLLDALGRITLFTAFPVVNGSVNSTIDLGNVSNGIYVVQVTVNGKVMTSRLSVDR